MEGDAEPDFESLQKGAVNLIMFRKFHAGPQSALLIVTKIIFGVDTPSLPVHPQQSLNITGYPPVVPNHLTTNVAFSDWVSTVGLNPELDHLVPWEDYKRKNPE